MLAEEGGQAGRGGGGGGGEAVLRSDDPTWQLVSESMAAAFLSELCVAAPVRCFDCSVLIAPSLRSCATSSKPP